MTYAQERKLYELVRWSIRRWLRHEDYDDILSESLILVWQRIQRLGPAVPFEEALARSLPQARFGYANWSRRWYGRFAFAGEPRPEVVALEAIRERAVGDSAARIIRRVDGQRLLEQAKALCPPRQAQALELIAWRGMTQQECAAAMGVSRGAIGVHYSLAVKKCRVALR